MSMGMAILVDKMTAPLVKENDIMLESRAQYVTLQLLGNDSLTIVNIYVAKSSNDKAPSWKKDKQGRIPSGPHHSRRGLQSL
jgi:hypothetical protein